LKREFANKKSRFLSGIGGKITGLIKICRNDDAP
jgi:hypothetical protein